MSRNLALALALFVAVSMIGLLCGWYFRSDSAAELEQLNRDWGQVVAWADLPGPGSAKPTVVQQLLEDMQGLVYPENLFGLEAGQWVVRAELSPEIQASLQRFEQGLAKGGLGVPDGTLGIAKLMMFGSLVVKMEDMTPERMGQVLGWTRTLHREGSTVNQVLGISLATEALKRCQSDLMLIPMDFDLPAPTLDEAFFGICRDYVLRVEQVEGRALGLRPFRAQVGDEFMSRAMRRALANNALRYFPKRNDRTVSQGPEKVEMPGPIEVWFSSTFGKADSVVAYLEGSMAMGQTKERWVTFVDLWQEVLGE